MKQSVFVFGGGIGGLTAAHELTEGSRANYFDVTVFESSAALGGKALSQDVAGVPPAAQPFPGEHGFRFFPSFYRHVVDTMSRIPSAFGRASVADHLVETTLRLIARYDADPILMPSAPSLHRLDQLITFLTQLFGAHVTFAAGEVEFFAGKLLRMATSCKKRRIAQYESQSWWEFLEADQGKSDNYKNYLARGLTRTLVAAKPDEINAMTGGDVLVRLMIDPGVLGHPKPADRVLDGPTSRVWIDPWHDELANVRGVDFKLETTLHSLTLAGGGTAIDHVTVIQPDGSPLDVQAEYYVCALPVERMAEVLDRSPSVRAAGDRLDAICTTLRTEVRSMTGLQFYLNGGFTGVPSNLGHQLYVDSDWALTSIAQSTFWRPPFDDLTVWGDGNVKTVWSTILSDWHSPHPAAGGVAAQDCDAAQLHEHTLQQLERSLNFGMQRFDRSMVLASNLDQAMRPARPGQPCVNAMPLLVNYPNRWALRPDSAPAGLDNLFLAADYVRTNTDLATMEGANEAARAAVNEILARAGVPGNMCMTFDLYYPEVLADNLFWKNWIRFDEKALKWGLDWSMPPFQFTSPFP